MRKEAPSITPKEMGVETLNGHHSSCNNLQEKLPGFKIPATPKKIAHESTQTNVSKNEELHFQAQLWLFPRSLETFNLILEAENYLKSDNVDCKTTRYTYLREKRRELSNCDNNPLMYQFNKSYHELRKKWSSDSEFVKIREEEAKSAAKTGKAEYFMTENSIIFLNTIQGDVLTYEKGEETNAIPSQ